MHIYTISISTADGGVNVGTIYFSISLALNLLLTLMIVVRLILHNKNIQRATGTSGGATGLYTTVVTMLIESSALYAIAFLSYIIPLALQNWVAFALSKTVGQAQVRVSTAFSKYRVSWVLSSNLHNSRLLPRISSSYGSPSGEH